ncbi:MAG: hypothetical protein ACFE0P_12395 [Oceanicaulis sp.]
MRDAKAIAKTRESNDRLIVAASSLVLLVVVLITSITGAAAPV